MTTSPIDYTTAPSRPARRFDWVAPLARLGPLIGLVFVFCLFAVLVHVVPRGQLHPRDRQRCWQAQAPAMSRCLSRA